MAGEKRIGILVVAYNAAGTLHQVLDRIPPSFRPKISEILIADDASQDATHLVGLGYQQLGTDLPITVVRRPENLGYGGNQKAGYEWAIERGLDIVVLLHGDGQYAPEMLPEIVAPLERDAADAVFGSRMLEKGAARKGGMPLYKYLGNRVLTTFENKTVGLNLSEWHSGYRAYSVAALKEIPFEKNANDFHFDSEIIVQLKEAGKRIAEVPIPTYYGDEICYVNGMRYAKDVTRVAMRYRAHKMGFGTGELAFATRGYELKTDGIDSSHQRLISWLRSRPAARILDLGCSDGSLGALLVAAGHEVVGVDIEKLDGVQRLHEFYEADLDQGIPDEVGGDFDIVLCADVLEHVRDPRRLMAEAAQRVRAGGSIMASVPNFGHWYPRTRVAMGLFDYDRRGILDDGHVRFFTRRSFEHTVARAGLQVRRREAVGLPLQVVERGGESGQGSGGVAKAISRVDQLAVAVRPTLFGYQFLYELEVAPTN